MARKKQQLTPKVPDPKPQAPPKGRPRVNMTAHDYYCGVALGGLLARTPGSISPHQMLDIKKEANLWADLMLKTDE